MTHPTTAREQARRDYTRDRYARNATALAEALAAAKNPWRLDPARPVFTAEDAAGALTALILDPEGHPTAEHVQIWTNWTPTGLDLTPGGRDAGHQSAPPNGLQIHGQNPGRSVLVGSYYTPDPAAALDAIKAAASRLVRIYQLPWT